MFLFHGYYINNVRKVHEPVTNKTSKWTNVTIWDIDYKVYFDASYIAKQYSYTNDNTWVQNLTFKHIIKVKQGRKTIKDIASWYANFLAHEERLNNRSIDLQNCEYVRHLFINNINE